MTSPTRLGSFDDVALALDALERAPAATAPAAPGAWTVGQVLAHCAQSVEYSMTGYPRARSALFRATIGRLALSRFLARGAMSHDVAGAIPGAPEVPATTTTAEGLARLRAAIAAFRAHPGDLAPHFAYGPVARADYERVHAMHIADHLAALARRG